MPRPKMRGMRVSPEVRKIQMRYSRLGKPISVTTARAMYHTNIAGKAGQLGNKWGR